MLFKSLQSARVLARHIGSAALAAAICVATTPSPSQAETPDYFVEWVQPSAALRVDTGVRGKVGVKAEVQFIHRSNGDYPVLLGSWGGNNKRFNLVMHWGEQGRWEYGNQMNNLGGFPWYGLLTTVSVEVPANGAMSCTWTNTEGGSMNHTMNATATYGLLDTETTLTLFASHYKDASSESFNQPHLGRLYYCKLWEGDTGAWTLSRDFRPCVKDGVAGLYDSVEGVIHYPAGNVLVAGPVAYDTIATWNGGTTPTAAELATASNWTCTDKNGDSVASAVPDKATLVVFPAGIGSVTLPDGYVVPWGAVRAEGGVAHPATQYGTYTKGRDFVIIPAYGYTVVGEGSLSDLVKVNGATSALNYAGKQVRHDGWFYVNAAQAGTWKMDQDVDDYYAFFIDDVEVLGNHTYTPGVNNVTCTVTEGWHRFTSIVGDTGGGWGMEYKFGNDYVPFTITVNDATYTITDDTTFPKGSGTSTITLSADANWSALGKVVLQGGARIDLNGHSLVVDDILADDYVGTVITNSAAKKSVLYFLGDPLESKAYTAGIIKQLDEKIILAHDGDQIATWTGSVSGDPANANNWLDLAGEPVVPTSAHAVKITGNNVNMQAPAGTDIACKSFEIGNCTFTADCDWRGLSVKPIIAGTANLDGHVLKLNNLSAAAGSAFSGGEGSTVEFAPPSEGATYAKMGESAYIDNIVNLTNSGDVKFLLSKDGAGGTLTVTELDLGKMHYAEFVQTNGTVNLGNVWCAIGGKDSAAGHGVYRMTGGTLTASIDFTVGSRGLGEFIQTGGEVTLSNWLNIGRNGGKGILTIDGGRMVNTYNKEVYVGAEGGTGIINVGGNGYLEVYNLPLGAWNVNNTKGYVNISGNGHLKARNWVALCNNNSSNRSGMWGEVNQSGGTFEITTDFAIGERKTGTGVYNLTGGDMTVRLMQIGWNSGSVGRMTMSGGTATTSSDFYVGRDGTGTFNLSGGDMTVGALTRIAWGSGGVGTMTMDGGTFTVNGDQLLVADWGKGTFTQNAGTVTVTKVSAYVGIGQSSGSVGTYTLNGGTLVTPQVKKGAGKGTLILNGGTIVATNVTDGANFISGLDNVTYGPGGLTLDSAGYNVTMAAASGANVVASEASTFTKTGDGTLTVAAVPPVGNIVVSNGTLALSASCDNTAPVGIAHRWSFTSDLTDSVTGTAGDATASAGVTYSDGKASLTGGDKGTCYINLGANKLPSDSVTLEFWTTITTRKVWTKMFCLGKDSGSCLAFTFNRNSDSGVSGLDVAPNGGTYTGTGTLAANTPYYLAFTLKPNASGGTEGKGYSYNATSGALVGSLTKTGANWSLIDKILQQSFCLGYSFWNDPDAYADYDEVRVWCGALSADAIALSATKGPDATADDIAAIIAATSAATPVERTLNLESGATLSIASGQTLTQPVVTGSGMVAGGTLVVSDKVFVKCGETLTASGMIDLTNAKVELVDPENLTNGFYFIKAAPSATLNVVGKPEAVNLPNGWQISVTSSGAKIQKVGFTIFLR